MKINNKELSGCSYADGTHWYWGGKEVAVMDDLTGEIEWCVRTNSIPNAVVEAVRSKKPKAAGQWLIEVKRVSQSATQGIAHVRESDSYTHPTPYLRKRQSIWAVFFKY